MTETPSDVKKVADLAKDIRIGMLTTIDSDGHFISRPMAQQEVEFDGDLWFFAERNSRKVAHITANPHVGVTLTSNDTWISLDGDAEIVDDPAKAKELWNSGWRPGCRRARGSQCHPDQSERSLCRVLGHPGRPDRVRHQLCQGQGYGRALRRRRERAGQL